VKRIFMMCVLSLTPFVTEAKAEVTTKMTSQPSSTAEASCQSLGDPGYLLIVRPFSDDLKRIEFYERSFTYPYLQVLSVVYGLRVDDEKGRLYLAKDQMIYISEHTGLIQIKIGEKEYEEFMYCK
jgi:hypothetical protein